MLKIEVNKVGEPRLKTSTVGCTSSRLIVERSKITSQNKFVAVYDPDFVKQKNQVFDQMQKIKFNISDRTSGLSSESLIFGFAPEDPLKVLPARLVKNKSDTQKLWMYLLGLANKMFDEAEPELAQKQRQKIKEIIHPSWILPGGLFTSGIINKSTQLRFHTDNGNVTDCMSVMFCFKRGVEGGALNLPEFNCSIDIAHGSALLFDGQGVSHGVEPFKRINQDSARYTIVFYALEKLKRAAESREAELKKFNQSQMRKLK